MAKKIKKSRKAKKTSKQSGMMHEMPNGMMMSDKEMKKKMKKMPKDKMMLSKRTSKVMM